jgi:hypothetical protein
MVKRVGDAARRAAWILVPLLLLQIFPIVAAGANVQEVNVPEIIERSVKVNGHDWRSAPEYNNFEREAKNGHTRTKHVLMIFGSPYNRLVAVDGKPLSPAQNAEEDALTGMEGKLWIDKETYHWVKVEAQVIHPVSIVGFLAEVEPGTSFVLEQVPVTPSVWLPNHFSVKSHAKILGLFSLKDQEDDTYFDYQKASTIPGAELSESSNSGR